ncbi:MAG: glycosyltransferase, partial [Desulfobacteraceae bacterium]
MTALLPHKSSSNNNLIAKPRLLVFIVAYNAEASIASVLSRIPYSLTHNYDVEILIIDDSSRDNTFEVAESIRKTENFAFPLHVLYNPDNQGYGGNQKIGYHFAVTK